MPTPDARALVLTLFARFSAGDLDGVLSLLDDQVSWRIPGKPGTAPFVGPRNRRQIEKIFRAMAAEMDGPLAMTVTGLIAEGDRVAVEVDGHGRLRNGRVYENQYHFAITVANGKIVDVHEYYDTQHALETWVNPASR
jgi:uncharacterized protein